MRIHFVLFAGLVLSGWLACACGGEPVRFGPQSSHAAESRPTDFGQDQRQRFGLRDMRGARPQAPATAAAGFVATAPTGWQEAPPSEFRQLNYRIAEQGECYLTAGNLRGGRLANVNRWVAGQFGGEPLSAQQFEALSRHPLLGSPAVLVEVEGSFRGMDGAPRDGFKLLGLVGGSDEDLVTLKFLGPKELVDQERGRFLAFAASIRRRGEGSSTAAGGSPPQGAPAAGDAGLVRGDGFFAPLPAGWAAAPTSSFRQLNFKIGQAGECYLTAGGLRGGLLANVNRWVAQQFGQRPLSAAEFSGLPRHALLGGEAALVRVEGSFAGMGGGQQPGFALLGLVGGTDDDMVTLKFLGPKELVAQEEARFLQLAAAIRREGQDPAPAMTTPPPADVAPADVAPRAGGAKPFSASIPSDWRPLEDTPSRALRHGFGSSGEFYVGQLGGEALQMLSIWCGEMGAQPLDQAGMEALALVPMLGGKARLLDLSGTHAGAGGQSRTGMRLLVAVFEQGGGVVFCKCIGEAAEVERERSGFLTLCETLRRNDG